MNYKKKIIVLSTILATTDLISKYAAKKYLISWNIDLFLWAKFVLVYNQWIAFSIPIKWLIQIIASFIVLWILFYYANKNWNFKKNLAIVSISLITSWAIWNLYERILFWKVTDFISAFSWYPTFNLADSFIFIGVILILFFEKKFKKLI